MTQDRIKGPKGNKTYQTRRRSKMYYGSGNFCSMWCYNDWAETFIDRAVDHFGRITQPKVLTQDNAWVNRRTWSYDDNPNTYYAYNHLTEERRPITEQQYNDDTNIDDQGRLNI